MATVQFLQGHKKSLRITTPGGLACVFDGQILINGPLFDAKVGYDWLSTHKGQFERWQLETIARNTEELGRCKRVAFECGYFFLVICNNPVGKKGLETWFPSPLYNDAVVVKKWP